MKQVQQFEFKFDTKAATPGDVNTELTAIKFLMTALFLKLPENIRVEMIGELEAVDNPVISNMLDNFKMTIRK
nr:hypothetical protein [Providencia stuartii]ELR5082915.1 hypothetical protein [Providencia stuartii]